MSAELDDPKARTPVKKGTRLLSTYRVLARWVVFGVLALAAIVTGALSVIGQKVVYGPVENRTLAKLSAPTPARLINREYFASLNTWANDHQALRSPLIAINSALKLHVFKTALDGETIIGLDGYYFYGHAQMIEDFTRKRKIEDDQTYLRGLLAYFKSLDAWAKENGRLIFFMITPNSHNVYSEYFSSNYTFGGGPSTAEKLDAWLEKHLPHMALPVTEPLRAAKEAGVQVYYRTDTHWTPNGAKIGSDAIFAKVRQLRPDLKIPTERKYTLAPVSRSDGNYAVLLNLPLTETIMAPKLAGPFKAKRDSNYERQLISDVFKKKPRVLLRNFLPDHEQYVKVAVLGDSFMSYLIPFVSEAAGTSLFYNSWGFGWKPELRFPMSIVDEFDPDVIVFQLVERRIKPCGRALVDNPDDETGCQSNLVPRLPLFAAMPRLRALFTDGVSPERLGVSTSKNRLVFTFAEAVPEKSLAVVKVKYKGTTPVHLKHAGPLAEMIFHETTEASFDAKTSEGYLILNVEAKSRATAALSASRDIEADEFEFEVRIVPDDIDTTLPPTGQSKSAATQ